MNLYTLLLNETYTLIQGNINQEIEDICFDSRNYQPHQLFIALKGSLNDGHNYIQEVINKGCKVMIVQEEGDYPLDITIIKVENTLKTLAKISANFFNHPEKKIELIGITGTSGKTTTSFILKALLETNYKVGLIGTNGAYYHNKKIELNNTTPSSYHLYQLLDQMVKEKMDICILEVSSQALKYHRVEGLFFKHALITNMSKDHIGKYEHQDMQDYVDSKKKLFDICKYAYLNNDDHYCEDIKKGLDCTIYTYGFNQGDFYIDRTLSYFYKTYFKVKGKINDEFMTTLIGNHNLYNILGALSIAYHYDLHVDSMKEVLKDLRVEGRFEIYRHRQRTFVIDYAHNQDSYKKLFETIHAFPFKRVILVIGAGGNRSKTRRKEVMNQLKDQADLFILTEDNSRNEDVVKIVDELKEDIDPSKVIIEYQRDKAILKAFEIAQAKDIVVIAGKGHEQYLIKKNKRIPFNDTSFLKSLLKE